MKQEKLDKFHYHEILDRLNLIASNIDDFLLEHPVAHQNKKIHKKISKALENIVDAYQIVGQKSLKVKQ